MNKITHEQIVSLDWTLIAIASNGGTKSFQLNNYNPFQRNKPPFYLLEYNGDNQIYERNNDRRLYKIKIEKLTIDVSNDSKMPVYTTLYEGEPQTIDDLRMIIEDIKKKNDIKNRMYSIL